MRYSSARQRKPIIFTFIKKDDETVFTFSEFKKKKGKENLTERDLLGVQDDLIALKKRMYWASLKRTLMFWTFVVTCIASNVLASLLISIILANNTFVTWYCFEAIIFITIPFMIGWNRYKHWEKKNGKKAAQIAQKQEEIWNNNPNFRKKKLIFSLETTLQFLEIEICFELVNSDDESSEPECPSIQNTAKIGGKRLTFEDLKDPELRDRSIFNLSENTESDPEPYIFGLGAKRGILLIETIIDPEKLMSNNFLSDEESKNESKYQVITNYSAGGEGKVDAHRLRTKYARKRKSKFNRFMDDKVNLQSQAQGFQDEEEADQEVEEHIFNSDHLINKNL